MLGKADSPARPRETDGGLQGNETSTPPAGNSHGGGPPSAGQDELYAVMLREILQFIWRTPPLQIAAEA